MAQNNIVINENKQENLDLLKAQVAVYRKAETLSNWDMIKTLNIYRFIL